MYQNIYIQREKGQRATVHLWDDNKGYYSFPYKNYAYKKDAGGMYVSLSGEKLKKVARWEDEDLKKGLIYESDVPMETRVLIDTYGESDEPSKGITTMFFDIEVEVTDGFPDPLKAENKITSIALYDSITEQYTALVLDPDGKVNPPTEDNINIESFYSEEELLQNFCRKYQEIRPHIITGWNSDKFDIPYLYNRLIRVLGFEFANALSPLGKVRFNERQERYKIAGVSSLDYLRLYKNFTFKEQASYRLDYIGEVEVGMKKVEYDGSLMDLYDDDINKFVDYNIHDVRIVVALDEKLKMIELVRGLSHMCHIPYEEIYFSSRYLEGAILTHLRKIEVVAPNKPERKKGEEIEYEKFSGAYVKDPKAGRHEWVFDLDVTSMYPSIIMSLNISPETKVGRLEGWDSKEFLDKDLKKTYTLWFNDKELGKHTASEIRGLLEKNKISIASNGVMYNTERPGLMPTLLDTWFNARVEFRKLAKEAADRGDDEKYEYFNRRQYIQKVVLNSLYGVLGLSVFRFYDLDNAEATTLTGQHFIKFSQQMSNLYYNKKLGTNDEDYCIYIDTDSLFYPSIPMIENKYKDFDKTDDEFMSEKTIEVAGELQDFLNKSYDRYAKVFLNLDEHRFNIKQEVVAKSGVWITKKRYGQWIIRDAGVVVNKLDIKGLDIIRSNFPEAFRDYMKDFLMDILKNEPKDAIDKRYMDFKSNLASLPVTTIAQPTSVKNISKYTDKEGSRFNRALKGTPVHVKSALNYNDFLEHHKLDKKHESIANGSKIKWVYLRQNPYGMQTMGFKGYDDPKDVMDYLAKYIDTDKMFKGALEKKVDMFYQAMKWSQPVDVTKTLDRFF
tara:strand:- start:3156 stop:5681 length:2526 start_codon:yes stop_codon:yes gene_type:complete